MSTDEIDYQDDLAYIENHVGQLRGNQKYEVIDALDEDRDGVRALASKIGATEGLDSPAAVFVAAIRRGDHRESAGGSKVERRTPREALRGFFLEYREWLADVADLDENRCIEYALDYAVSSMSAYTPRINGKPVRISAYERGQTPLTLEDELRDALDRPRPATTGAERTRMNTEWVVIGLCLHDRGIAEMHHALMAQCAITREPTHAEARDARAALIDEIRARGVQPKQPVGPLGPALQEAVELVGKAHPASGTLGA